MDLELVPLTQLTPPQAIYLANHAIPDQATLYVSLAFHIITMNVHNIMHPHNGVFVKACVLGPLK